MAAVLRDMNRTERFSEPSSGLNEKQSLSQRVATMTAFKEQLLNSLMDLSYEDHTNFLWLLQFTLFQRGLPYISWGRLQWEDWVDILVETMVETCGQQAGEVTGKVFMDMNWTDLVQGLSDTSSGPEAAGSSAEAFDVKTTEGEKHSVDEHWPSLIQKVEFMASAIELLLETMADLSETEFKNFKEVFQSQSDFFNPQSDILFVERDRQNAVFLMVQTYGQKSVESTKKILKEMKRADLVHRLSYFSTRHKNKGTDEHVSALIQKVATMAAVEQLLLETMNVLSYKELEKFKEFLQLIVYQKNLPDISSKVTSQSDKAYIVHLMVQTYGQQSVEVIREIFMNINRTDLVKRLSKPSPGFKEEHSVEEPRPSLFERREAIAADKQNILETLKNLSSEELEEFKWCLKFTYFQKSLPKTPWSQVEWTDSADALVDLMVESLGQQSVEVTKEILIDMNRTDLVERLSEISSGPKDKHPSKLLQNEVILTSFKEEIYETLQDLREEEFAYFKWYLQQPDKRQGLPGIPKSHMENAGRAQTVDLMVYTYGEQSVEVTRKVLERIRRIDLVQRLTDISSGSKETHPSKPSQKDVAITLEMKLLETLEDLNRRELQEFKWLLQQPDIRKDLPGIPISRMENADRAQTVELMVQTYGEQSVEVTREVLVRIRRIDLVQRLTDISSGSKEKHSSKLPKKKEMLLGTIEDLSHWELEEFKWYLQNTTLEKRLSGIPVHSMKNADHCDIVNLMVEHYGEHSVEVTRKVLVKINRNDMVQKLSYISSGSQEKHPSKPCLKEVTMTSFKIKLLNTFEDLCGEDFAKVKWYLQQTAMRKGLPGITKSRMENARRAQIVDLLVDIYGEKSVEVTREVLKMINRNDLVETLTIISSGSKGPSRSLALVGGGSTMQASIAWTKLHPEVISSDADEAPTYSLQSEAGNFECSVSGLRWVCTEKVNLKYQFCSSEEHMERIESMQYMPAGTLMNITVIHGKLDVVYMQHWICIDDNPTLLDQFAVLHIDDCGDVVEKVSEVTPTHVKLSNPDFSLKMVLVKAGIPVKINCNVLIYKTSTPSFTLHVYLIPPDKGLYQELNKVELDDGYKLIRWPNPEKSLKMHDSFILTADLERAQIYPEKLMLRYRNPNFFNVIIENPDMNFKIHLTHEHEDQPVWTCAIQKAAGSSDEASGVKTTEAVKHSVEEQRFALIQKAAKATTDRERLLIMLQDLGQIKFDDFMWYLKDEVFMSDLGLPCFLTSQLENKSRRELVDLMLQKYTQHTVEVTKKVFTKIDRNDLVQMLSDTSSGPEASGSSI